MLKEIVSRDLVTLEPHQTVLEAARLMEEKGVGCVLVLSNGRPRGLLTDRDIVVRCVARNLDTADTTIENILTESLALAHVTDDWATCIHKMREAGVRRMPVIGPDNKVVGIVTFDDLIHALSRELSELAETAMRHAAVPDGPALLRAS